MPTILWAGLTMTGPDWEPHANYAVCVDGPRIVAVGRRNELVARYPGARQFGDERLLLMPGLVNSHDHGRGLSTLAGGFADDLLEVWLPALRSVTAVDRYLLSLYESLWLLRAGVTATTHAHLAYSPARLLAECEQALLGYRATGIRVALQPTYADQPGHVYATEERFLGTLPAGLRKAVASGRSHPPLTPGDYFAVLTELYEKYHDRSSHRIHVQAGPAGSPWSSDELLLEACDWARAQRTRLHTPLLETRYQRADALRRWGKSTIQHWETLGALSPALTLAHVTWADTADLARLAAHGVAVVHCPSSDLRLRGGIAPLAALLAHGIQAGVGLDGHALDDDQDFLRELRLAWTLAHAPGAGASAIAAQTVLQMGTAGGAAATFGPEIPLGVVAPGALADLVMLDWHALRGLWAAPEADVAALLLRRAARSHVRDVMVNGEWVVRDGRATRVDEGQVQSALIAQLERLKAGHNGEEVVLARQLAPYLRRFYAAWESAPP